MQTMAERNARIIYSPNKNTYMQVIKLLLWVRLELNSTIYRLPEDFMLEERLYETHIFHSMEKKQLKQITLRGVHTAN